jgi:hypothetical protein
MSLAHIGGPRRDQKQAEPRCRGGGYEGLEVLTFPPERVGVSPPAGTAPPPQVFDVVRGFCANQLLVCTEPISLR